MLLRQHADEDDTIVAILASKSPRLIDLQQNLDNQSRRFRPPLLREGRIDVAARETRTRALQDAILAQNRAGALSLLEEGIKAELTTEPTTKAITPSGRRSC